MARKDLDFVSASKYIHYWPETGEMFWAGREREEFQTEKEWKHWQKNYQGKVAGTLEKKRENYHRVVVTIKQQRYISHRLIWAWMKKETPPKDIDHKNRNPCDNRWMNLRDGWFINPKNKSKNKDNSSGMTGVRLNPKNDEYIVMIQGMYLGEYETKKDAYTVSRFAYRFLGYDDEHGL